MERETAKALLEAIKDAAEIAISAQNKIAALERALKAQLPDLYEQYQRELKDQQPTTSFDPVAFSTLLGKLTQH